MTTWLKFVGLCRKSGRFRLAAKTLNNIIGCELQAEPSKLPIHYPRVPISPYFFSQLTRLRLRILKRYGVLLLALKGS